MRAPLQWKDAQKQMPAPATQDVVVIGIAADSGCGKSTFVRRLTSIFGGKTSLLDIGRETLQQSDERYLVS